MKSNPSLPSTPPTPRFSLDFNAVALAPVHRQTKVLNAKKKTGSANKQNKGCDVLLCLNGWNPTLQILNTTM